MIRDLPKSNGIVGRRDLLVAILSKDAAYIESVGESLGLERRPSVEPLRSEITLDDVPSASQDFVEPGPSHANSESPESQLKQVVWVPTTYLQRQAHAPISLARAEHRWSPTGEPASPRAIASWPQVLPRMREMLDESRPRKQLNLTKILDRVSKRELLHRLPVLYARSWGRRIVVVKDTSVHLTSFVPDQDLAIRSLRTMFSVESWSEVHGPSPDALWHRDPVTGGPLTFPKPFENVTYPTTILVLGDLGCCTSRSTNWTSWLRWGERLRGRGCRMYALYPGNIQHVPRPLRSLFTIQTWQPARVAIKDPERRRALLDQLFNYASPALRLEPGLLRDLRLLIPGATDASLETDFWLDDRLANRSPSGAMIDRECVQQELMPQLRQLPDVVQQRVVTTIRRWRMNHSEDPELWFEEVLSLPAELQRWVGEDLEAARASVRELLRRMRLGGKDAESIETWFYNQSGRLPPWAYEDPEVGEHLRQINREMRGSRVTILPGTDPAELPAGEEREYAIHVDDGNILIVPQPEKGKTVGSSTAIARSRNRTIQLEFTRESFWKSGQCPDFVVDYGTDSFGAWFEFEVRGDGGEVARQRMRWIPAGSFVMGSPPEEEGRYEDEGHQHLVTLTKGFWMADTPFTERMWHAMMKSIPSRFRGLDLPVGYVSWDDAVQLCAALSQQLSGVAFRLPTEAEWEYACRAGTTTPYWFGERFDATMANGGGTVGEPTAVKTYPANSFGLFDVHGNVWEWCSDYWSDWFTYEDQVDPQGPVKGFGRVVRGGSWSSNARSARSAHRRTSHPGERKPYLGFRLLSSAVEAEPSETAVLPVAKRGATPSRIGGAQDIPQRCVLSVSEHEASRVETPRGTPGIICTDLDEWRFERWTAPEWAKAFGEDAYGMFADLEIVAGKSKAIRQRLRWIPPGRFCMGSPTTEPGRFSDEVEHEVVITNGYWMFDAPCTQTLWTVIMNANPSGSHGLDLPVENVDWFQASAFADALTKRIGHTDLRFSLPTEAQWEYACRAGTRTATYAGNLDEADEKKCPVLDEIAWYAGNLLSPVDHEKPPSKSLFSNILKFLILYTEPRSDTKGPGTRKVKQKRPNAWGLYDMLGNVWEWCSDCYGKYDLRHRTDPMGPSAGSGRVVRGGGWIHGTRVVRSACRDWFHPGAMRDHLGFRLLSSNKSNAEPAIDKASP